MSKNTDLAAAVSNQVVSVTGSGNATVLAADIGKTFAMALGTYGILTLPDPTTLSYGWYVNVVVTGSPATFQGAYITHAGTLGSKFVYRGTGYNTFILIGNNESFRIWLNPAGTFYVTCISQPLPVSCTRTYTGSGAWNSTATNWQTAPLNTFTGATTCYNNPSNGITVGAAGYYKLMYRIQLWNNDSITATLGRGLAINGSLYQYDVGTITTQQSNYYMLNSTVFANPGDVFSMQYYTSNSTTWYYPDTDMLTADLINR